MTSIRVMLIDEDRTRSAVLKRALLDAGYEVVARVDAGDDVLKRVTEVKPDVIIVDMEAPDRDILENVRAISHHQPKPIVMFAESSDSDMIKAAVGAGVSAYVIDGLSDKRVKPIIEVAIARFREFHALRTELARAKQDLAERKIVAKAKGILMKHKGLSEDQAYVALRKMAMDRNQRLGEVAQSVITVADLLT
jgi:response regulator NasT